MAQMTTSQLLRRAEQRVIDTLLDDVEDEIGPDDALRVQAMVLAFLREAHPNPNALQVLDVQREAEALLQASVGPPRESAQLS